MQASRRESYLALPFLVRRGRKIVNKAVENDNSIEMSEVSDDDTGEGMFGDWRYG
jgi:hypothetical protein